MPRQNISYNQPLAEKLGYSRAVRIGNVIAVTGTAAIAPDGSTAGIGDPYLQAKRCLEIIQDVIEKAGATMEDVIRTRILVKNIQDWPEVTRAHGECFANILPACTFIAVKGFINPEWLVEIEADAVITELE